MCTSIITNFHKTLIGWNLDLLDMEYKVVADDETVYIAINDAKEGWMPLFGANNRGDFIAMPTCWPYDQKSDPPNPQSANILLLDMDLLLKRKTLAEIKKIAAQNEIYSIPGVTFQAQLSDKDGNVLQITPGQGFKWFEKPLYSIMTNFSPFKGDSETHPWMGWDRYLKAEEILSQADGNFDVQDCFEILKETSQEICPTVVSMVFDISANTVYWCENRDWQNIQHKQMLELKGV